jgi:hypothetical protein
MKIWFSIALILSAVLPMPNQGGSPAGCSGFEKYTGQCAVLNANIDDGSLTIGASSTIPGTGTVPPVVDQPQTWPNVPTGSHDLPPGFRDGYGVTGPLSLSDLASFTPTPGTDHMQPNGWAVLGVSTNFYAVVGQQVQNGTLLGRAASVRFTPKAYHWNYGDGISATRSTKGATWAAQGITDFDPTPTSHIYRATGSYTITLTIDFGAEYSYDGDDWVAVAGVLSVPTNPLATTVGTAKTVLVAKDCLADPSGPGC